MRRPTGGTALSTTAEAYLAQAADEAAGEHWSGPPELTDHLARLLEIRPGHRVLDVGCGIGGPARHLASHTRCSVVALDVVPELVAGARRRPSAAAHAPAFLAGRAEQLPVADSATDRLLALGTVAHVVDLRLFAEEAARVLTPGGRLAVTELFWHGMRAPAFARTAPSPWRPLRAAEVAGALDRSGFGEVDILRWPYPVPDVAEPLMSEDLQRERLVPGILVAARPGRR